MLDRIASAIKSAITRGKVANTRVGPRTFLQITGLDGVVQQTVELLLPPGYSARPVVGADLVLLQVMGSGDHVVALGGDMAGNAIADLAPGEFGLSDGTQMIIFRVGNMIQIKSPTKVRIESPLLECTGAIIADCDSGSVGLTTHKHGTGTAASGTVAPTAGT
jgi:phage gp45-like